MDSPQIGGLFMYFGFLPCLELSGSSVGLERGLVVSSGVGILLNRI